MAAGSRVGRGGARKKNGRDGARQRIEGSYVYVVSGDHNMVKIGVTTNPEARLARLRTGSPYGLEFAFVASVIGDGYDVEKEAHRRLADRRMNGEWFDVPAEAAVETLRESAAAMGERLTPYGARSGRRGVLAHIWNACEWGALMIGSYWAAHHIR